MIIFPIIVLEILSPKIESMLCSSASYCSYRSILDFLEGNFPSLMADFRLIKGGTFPSFFNASLEACCSAAFKAFLQF